MAGFAHLAPEAGPRTFSSDDAFLDYVERQTFRYFWNEANPANGLIRDRSRSDSPCSIAAVGFGLSAIEIAIERGWIDRASGANRVLKALQTLWGGGQGKAAKGCAGYHGWFYHFLDMETGLRVGESELSTVDTALLMLGVIDARQFFTSPSDQAECEIRRLAHSLVARIDWSFMLHTNEPVLSMEWKPETGYGPARWIGYNEASCLYLLGLGSPNSALPSAAWDRWTSGYQWEKYSGERNFVSCPSLFTHQYSQVWIDFRGIADAYMRGKSSDYFENSREATLAQREYSIKNPLGYRNYGADEWGFTACDGPGQMVEGVWYAGYKARGAPGGYDDGTIAPTAVGGSLPFAPEICLPALRHLYDAYGKKLWTTEGFRDAYNARANWWAEDAVGIDQGPILLMLENYRTGSTWSRMLGSPIIQRGLERAGFTAPPPDRLQARMITGDRIEVSWHNNAGYAKGLRVESSTNAVHFTVAAEVEAQVARTTIPASPNATYSLRVRTTSAAGVSGYRETVTVKGAPLAGPSLASAGKSKRD